MAGDTRQRFCESCQRTVHDLSALTRKQAEHLVKASSEGLCGRITHDGTGRIRFRPEPQSATQRIFGISLLGLSACAARASPSDARSCSVQVRVVDPTNSYLAGAHVTFSAADAAELPREAVTDSAGLINQHLDRGRYRLQVAASGFSTYSQDVDLDCRDESETSIDVQLQLGVMMGQVVEVRPAPANPFVRAWYRAYGLLWRLRHSL